MVLDLVDPVDDCGQRDKENAGQPPRRPGSENVRDLAFEKTMRPNRVGQVSGRLFAHELSECLATERK
jgi:hypothetical protein